MYVYVYAYVHACAYVHVRSHSLVVSLFDQPLHPDICNAHDYSHTYLDNGDHV